jgi:hypothetical protein
MARGWNFTACLYVSFPEITFLALFGGIKSTVTFKPVKHPERLSTQAHIIQVGTEFHVLRRYLMARLRSQTAAYLSPVPRTTDTGPRALHVAGCLGRRAVAGC